jgi:hypothetical protein
MVRDINAINPKLKERTAAFFMRADSGTTSKGRELREAAMQRMSG